MHSFQFGLTKSSNPRVSEGFEKDCSFLKAFILRRTSLIKYSKRIEGPFILLRCKILVANHPEL